MYRKTYIEINLDNLSNNVKTIINKYNNFKTEEEKRKFLEEHPGYEETIQIISEIDEKLGIDKRISQYLKNAREIKKFKFFKEFLFRLQNTLLCTYSKWFLPLHFPLVFRNSN